LKTNVRACKALGHPYVIQVHTSIKVNFIGICDLFILICNLLLQLGRIYLDMLNVYKVMSTNISAAIALNGEAVTKQPLIKSMRVVKKETIKLIADWISRSMDHTMVSKTSLQHSIQTC